MQLTQSHTAINRTFSRNSVPARPRVSRCHVVRCSAQQQDGQIARVTRRDALALAAGLALAGTVAQPANAIQGLTAGRIPGLSKEADGAGFYTYTRPEGKSGGHGVGWSEIPQYSFKVPSGWEEIPVSIADLGGTEIDLRYQSKDEGDVAVVVAPVLRFMDVGFNAKVSLKDVGPPQRVIEGFGPELFGKPLDEDDVVATEVVNQDGGLYYKWELKNRALVSATATKNRVFIITVTANARQWKKHSDDLRVIQQSFRVKQDA
ncbi:hypothetical protein HYH02_009007 [Chlamydomonas schloesseri]|uniref:PsbP C-terminal domain-containing protein n=1 Tax=Chlamydomonas schloesseri TaxID=2026947 RepID=A0A835WB21_9CHLO|nr:hypothetical protein HYH02_009007 [Chlamydomonas schloesseri]|eukprot:KAG2444064.1 hypothetical protein HYH02_009007 [Chlamydomonas schloesseri]